MGEFVVMLRNVLIFVALAIPGYIMVKLNIIKNEHTGVLSKLLMYMAMPFLIFSGVVNNLSLDKELLLMLGIAAFIGVIYTFILCFITGPLTRGEKNEKTRQMMRLSMLFANNGFLGIPLALAVFGKESQVFTMLILLNIINNIFLFTLGTYIMTGDKQSMSLKKAFVNPVVIAFLVGILFKIFNVSTFIPDVITFSDYFSGIVTPVSMTIMGIKLGSVKLSAMFKSSRLYYVSFVRLIISPVAIVAILMALKLLPLDIQFENIILAVFVAFAMPTAGLAATFADEYNGDTDNAVIFTLGTTVLSVLTIPTLYWVLNLFI